MTLTVIDGILLEGVDYIGKTTIALSLINTLTDRHQNIKHNKCFVDECELIRFLLRKAKQEDTLLERDWYYTTCCLIDLNRLQPPPEFLIQERHWFSQVVRNEFFYENQFTRYTNEIIEQHQPFSLQVYLTSDMQTKVSRANHRPPKSPRDRLLRDNPSLHQEFDEYSISRLPTTEDWRVVDTSDKTVEQIVTEILL